MGILNVSFFAGGGRGGGLPVLRDDAGRGSLCCRRRPRLARRLRSGCGNGRGLTNLLLYCTYTLRIML